MPIEVGCNRNVETKGAINISHHNNNPCLGCIARQVYIIDQAQKEASLEECSLSCGSKRLGDNVLNNNRFNTRPFSLYLPNGERLSILITDPTEEFISGNNSTNNNSIIDAIENNLIDQLNVNNANNNRTSAKSRPLNNTIINSSNNNPPPTTSDIFRVERIDGSCAVLRALVPRRRQSDSNSCNPNENRSRLLATCYCCTVDLDRFVCIQCFEDTFVPNLANCIE